MTSDGQECLSHSALAQDGIEVRQHFRRIPFLETDDLAGNFSLAIDDVRLRVHQGAVSSGDGRMVVFCCGVAVSGENYAVIAEKLFVKRRILIRRDAENNAVARID